MMTGTYGATSFANSGSRYFTPAKVSLAGSPSMFTHTRSGRPSATAISKASVNPRCHSMSGGLCHRSDSIPRAALGPGAGADWGDTDQVSTQDRRAIAVRRMFPREEGGLGVG